MRLVKVQKCFKSRWFYLYWIWSPKKIFDINVDAYFRLGNVKIKRALLENFPIGIEPPLGLEVFFPKNLKIRVGQKLN